MALLVIKLLLTGLANKKIQYENQFHKMNIFCQTRVSLYRDIETFIFYLVCEQLTSIEIFS